MDKIQRLSTRAIKGILTNLHKNYAFFTKEEKQYIKDLHQELSKREALWEPPPSGHTGRPPRVYEHKDEKM